MTREQFKELIARIYEMRAMDRENENENEINENELEIIHYPATKSSIKNYLRKLRMLSKIKKESIVEINKYDKAKHDAFRERGDFIPQYHTDYLELFIVGSKL